MRLRLLVLGFFVSFFIQATNREVKTAFADSILENQATNLEEENFTKSTLTLFQKRLNILDAETPMDLRYNEKVEPFIQDYLGKNKQLISRMQGLADYYFPLFEEMLDKYRLPLELRYLPIVESALNPTAKSNSGATGLWQFMYLTGKQYNLKVTSYIDERQDPIKSTEAACIYLSKLYDMFGDWHLVLAAYNGGPGYIQRKITSVGKNNFWELQEHLRKETRNYIPTFIAVNYAMHYANEHEIHPIPTKISFNETDTIILKKQVALDVLKELTCINAETISYLNPSYKKQIFPKGAAIRLPREATNDFLLNEENNYVFISKVDNKEILIDEERIIYEVKKGDYLGKIAKTYEVKIFEIKKWNNLKNTHIDIGEKLVLFIKNENRITDINKERSINEYVIQKGDTLWGIAQKLKGVSVSKIKSLNNLENDKLKPGTKLILPKT